MFLLKFNFDTYNHSYSYNTSMEFQFYGKDLFYMLS